MRIDVGGHELHVEVSGQGAPLVLAHGLGMDLRIWDAVLPLLPAGLRVIRYDARGHGQSDVPEGPYRMGGLVRDAERLLEALNVQDAVFCGLSLGGMVAQGLAVKRLDQIRALVLSNTAAKLGTPALWQKRAEAVAAQGLAHFTEGIAGLWFGRDFRKSGDVELWTDRLAACPVDGYTATCAAIGGTDFYTPTSGLRLPVLGLAGTEDRSTPPDLMRETVMLVPGAQFHMLRRVGHMAPVEAPEVWTGQLTGFLRDIGHIETAHG
ncbi:3-oxoadipate enol-lactonase [Candidatus Halocynthiibacter alkanivorans]|jgi:3-oxoadipate enol-lactonase|uniref:3-oxoadipate enol-lactonase n=1 Tax=Candidatus Halocynthiibacter alkanivorans TaxID=2267619 RepID=UPI000DF4C969|nr:3-oxoadipate enol-lactonase [Candidatus Halocynthiibacter alkanivorans]